MATLNSTISGSNTGDTLIGTASDQLISGGTGSDSIGSQFSASSLVGNDGNAALDLENVEHTRHCPDLIAVKAQ